MYGDASTNSTKQVIKKTRVGMDVESTKSSKRSSKYSLNRNERTELKERTIDSVGVQNVKKTHEEMYLMQARYCLIIDTIITCL